MGQNAKNLTLNIEDLIDDFSIVLPQLSSGVTILVLDEDDQALSYFVEAKLFKKLYRENSKLQKHGIASC